ncbi:hypothetical protein [Garciella nitratireducens]|uniref:Uncharacterized protein n=1 Tax=Garciella nitratireducens DSM 15102 TaxID=1121911 RepID=A0A1T4MVN2_9FIRM|nr:hypothetical protein [Garciella nitratireducens]SJZ70867.1 hypothetical protein SAMN02745973_01469 [Garciella nitratireducens DSM 15102]
MLKAKSFFKYGFLIGIFMFMLQQILFDLLGKIFLSMLYGGIFLLPIFVHRGKLSLGIFIGYIFSLIIFIFLVYGAYNIMVYFAR